MITGRDILLVVLQNGLRANVELGPAPPNIKSEATFLEIVDIKVAGQSITSGHPFTANDDWLDTFTFRVRNPSGKTISLLGFGIAFLKSMPMGRPQCSPTFKAFLVRFSDKIKFIDNNSGGHIGLTDQILN